MNTLIIKNIGGIIGVIVTIFLVYIITPFFISKRVDDALPAESVIDTTTAATSSLVGAESSSVREGSGIVEVPNKETVLVAKEILYYLLPNTSTGKTTHDEYSYRA
jgi:hypothetical protein